MKLRAMLGRATQNGQVMGRVMTKRGPLEKGMADHLGILAWEPRKQYEKEKR